MPLRNYQREAVDSIYAYFREHSGNPIVVLPVGSGKTWVLATFIREVLQTWPDQRILLLSHVKELLSQNAEKIQHVWPDVPLGIYSAGLGRKDTFNPVIVAGIQSVRKKALHLGRFDLILIDECHLLSEKQTGTYRQFIEDCRQINPRLKVIGLTATAFRMKHGDITEGDEALFTHVAYEQSMLDLVNQGYLSRLVGKETSTHLDVSSVHKRGGEFIAAELERAVDVQEVNEACCEEIIRYGKDRRSWLVFCAGVDHARHVCDILQDRNVGADMVTGKTPRKERDEIVGQFRNGHIKALVGVGIFTTGFDVPIVDLIAFLRPTCSPGLLVQMAGRGTRLSPGKENCLLLDFAQNLLRHGPIDLIRPWQPRRRDPNEPPLPAPTKACPECKTICAASLRECKECGYEFKIEPDAKLSRQASFMAPLSDGRAKPPVTYPITDVRYSRHTKAGKPPSMRVDYYSGLRKVCSEWVCFEHAGYPRRKAEQWWSKRTTASIDAPHCVEDAVFLLGKGFKERKVSHIEVNENDRYPNIVSTHFAETTRKHSADTPERFGDRPTILH